MLPTTAKDNLVDKVSFHTEPRRQRRCSHTLVSQFTDFKHNFLRKDVSPVFFAFQDTLSALGNHILDVISGSAHKQMFGIETSRIITVMENVLAFRNRPYPMFIGNPMSTAQPGSTIFTRSNLPVATRVARAIIFPAPAFGQDTAAQQASCDM
jgi:hypothetical protein